MNKYHAKKCNGFDSRLEARRYEMLKEMEARGEISELKTQVPFELIPSQYEPGKINSHTGEYMRGKLIERPCKYIADFTYIQDGKLVVEDAKGFERPEWIIKRKLMLYNYGIQVKTFKRTTR